MKIQLPSNCRQCNASIPVGEGHLRNEEVGPLCDDCYDIWSDSDTEGELE